MKRLVNLFLSPPQHKFFDKKWRRILKNTIGFKPKNWDYYFAAFTHKSKTGNKANNEINFERLELIGDAVLGLIIAEYFFHDYINYTEGDITKIRSRIVNRKTLNHIAKEKGFKDLIYSEFSQNLPENLYGNVFEAVVGAIYLDKGLKFAKKIVIKKLFSLENKLDELLKIDEDFKSVVFVWAQKRKKVVTFKTYKKGRNNDKFTTDLYIDEVFLCTAEGLSKKQAEQTAAEQAVSLLNIWTDV